jgi:hypothetical protein
VTQLLPGTSRRTIKAISLTQPWATLVAIGAKKIETRSWDTPYRGPIAIHASRRFPESDQMLCFREPFASALRAAGYVSPKELPTGSVLAIGQLVDCTQVFAAAPDFSAQELAFGDFSYGRWLWHLDSVECLPEPVEARGYLGLWEWRS